MLEADLSDPLLRAAAKLLAPFYLRLGGSLSDQLVYEEGREQAATPPLAPHRPLHASTPPPYTLCSPAGL